ncbi:beta-ketoacyl synthase N-terminal-like domain-containing protein [Rathayibacter agropyri]|uniref:beta-ketoacyl synthase N-terminal-like domain-containing protein n=1 Tax=Rathayibacter agropyri TaxID=1634927 RepID=UPI001564273F|nr:beta-ketoacyl-[acyl-carrier-protein] synthase family protein [Rathayibacter agropyri]
MGAVSPAGGTATAAAESMQTARGFTTLNAALSKELGEPVAAGHVAAFEWGTDISPQVARRSDRAVALAVAAAKEAVDVTGLRNSTRLTRALISVGSAAAGLASAEEIVAASSLTKQRPGPFAAPKMMINGPAAALSLAFGIHGPAETISTACASGTSAVGRAYTAIQDGRAELALAGGTDAPVSPTAVLAFGRMGALAQHRGEPSERGRPFDAARTGFVLAEGAAFLVLENWEKARQRGADIFGEILGFASNSDAYHVVSPRPDALLIRRCMEEALASGGLDDEEISHVNAHGTGTMLNDLYEANAIAALFGSSTPVTAYKGATGHMMGASGAFELVTDLLLTRSGYAPAIANLSARGPDIRIRALTESIGIRQDQPFMSNSFGFGGHNASLIARAFS